MLIYQLRDEQLAHWWPQLTPLTPSTSSPVCEVGIITGQDSKFTFMFLLQFYTWRHVSAAGYIILKSQKRKSNNNDETLLSAAPPPPWGV
jgi:hypothetical protein